LGCALLARHEHARVAAAVDAESLGLCRPKRLNYLVGISSGTPFHTFGGIFEKLLYSHRVRSTKLKHPPLFVLGHWRSGTTLLHELLILDKTAHLSEHVRVHVPAPLPVDRVVHFRRSRLGCCRPSG